MASELVGRDRELATLVGWVDEAVAGSPRAVLVTGDAGIGKSALTAVVAEQTRDRGLAVAVGRSTEMDGAPPFRPWRQVLSTTGGSALLDPMVALDPAVDRFSRFDAIVDHIAERATTEGGLLVIIEDVHGADDASAFLLAHLAEGLTQAPVCVIATARGRPADHSNAWAATVSTLARLPGSRHLELAGLGPASVAALLGADAEDDAVRRCIEATGGNPLLVTEQLRHLEAGGDPNQVPTSVVAAVAHRLSARSDACVAVLRVAAVVGRDFAAGLVATALDIPARTCLDAIGEAERAGFVESSGAGRFRFNHVLVRDAVAAGLDATESAQTHRRVAEAVEVYEGTAGDHLADLARHWAAAAVLGDGDIAASWCERAAAAADQRLAWEDAARLYDLADALAGPGADALSRHRWLLGSARARLHCDDISAAVDRCVRAADEIRHLGRADMLAEAALVVEGRGGPPLARIRSLAEEALAGIDAGDHETRARLLGQLTVCAFYLDPPAMADLSAAAMEAAERCGDGLALAAAARARQMALSGPEYADERLQLAPVIGRAGRELRRPSVVLWEPIWSIDALVELGRLPEAMAEVGSLRRRVDDAALPMARFHLYRIEALLAQATGRCDDALAWGTETCELFSRFEDPLGGQAMLVGLRTHLALHFGFDADLVDAYDEIDLAQAPAFLGDLPIMQPLLAMLGVGETARAHLLYERLVPVGKWHPPPFLALHLYSLRLLGAIGLGQREDIVAISGELGRHRGVHIAAGAGGLTYSGPVELWTGVAAAALDRWDDAVADLRHAYEVCRANGASGFVVQAGVELARSLLERSAADDVGESATVLDLVEPLADTLGMKPWSATIGDLRGQASASPERGPDTGPLSPREFEVAGLVAAGLTNRAIADHLFLSERTAQNHVQHILTKLQFSNRTQIATWFTTR